MRIKLVRGTAGEMKEVLQEKKLALKSFSSVSAWKCKYLDPLNPGSLSKTCNPLEKDSLSCYFWK